MAKAQQKTKEESKSEDLLASAETSPAAQGDAQAGEKENPGEPIPHDPLTTDPAPAPEAEAPDDEAKMPEGRPILVRDGNNDWTKVVYRTTRQMVDGKWQKVSWWFDAVTRKPISFEPTQWQEERFDNSMDIGGAVARQRESMAQSQNPILQRRERIRKKSEDALKASQANS